MDKNKFHGTLFCFPELPCENTVIYKISKALNLTLTNNQEVKSDIQISWEDTTFRKKSKVLNNEDSGIINIECNNISKKNVDDAFRKVFGYSSLVDPIEYEGVCVKKSNLNATHDGTLIQCPITHLEENFIYQKLINNWNLEFGIYDIRVPVFKDEIPVVYIKQKNECSRFEDKFKYSFSQYTSDVFSKKEYNQIIEFCSLIGMEYGELDILRDSRNNKIFIIDANNTPWWSTSLPKSEAKKVLLILAECFKQQFLYH